VSELAKFVLDQNNAGGYYLESMPKRATITAKDIDKAIEIAEMYGVDFADGCEGCCGDRWYVSPYVKEIHGKLPDLVDWLLKTIK
jgi:hypothetical protein